MFPTLLEDEYVLIDKLTPRFNDYRRGDIVVFTPPSGYEQEASVPFIKRVIGIPGDVVSLSNGHVFVAPAGGEPRQLDEPYLSLVDGEPIPTQPRDVQGTAEWTVPDGSYFVMGDNRDHSQDSRVFGPIIRDLIVGRAWIRYFPLNPVGFLDTPIYANLEGTTGLPLVEPAGARYAASGRYPPAAVPVAFVALVAGAASSRIQRSISLR